ncbi:hypothetical protein B0H63DRAFT_33599 [Podospora didyma]|uniref:C2H2-type domain-containing protein n=1 Tax=Podospora didyma TaxID=330526 RepID=A0AAE0U7V0_9PEZI|nr:hypothetical protein B0H63DRAFT_33599 [Podospora didyma]
MRFPRSVQMMQDRAVEMASPLTHSLATRSAALVARSTSLSGGAVAGAVVGSVAGVALIIICLLPFILRARRRWLNQYAPGQAEMGQSPGGPLDLPPHLADTPRRLEREHPPPSPGQATDTGLSNGHSIFYKKATSDQKPQQLSPTPALPPGLSTTVQGSQLPISPPLSPTSRPDSPSRKVPLQGDQAASDLTAADPSLHISNGPFKSSRRESRGTIGRDSTRELSLTDSYGSPSRQLTGITSHGITEEPESFERSSSHHRHFPHISESIRSLLHRRHPSQPRRDSKRSTLDDQDGTEGFRSPPVASLDLPTQPELVPIEFDTEIRGEAWSYYHDPSLGNDVHVSSSYIPPASVATQLSVVTHPHAPVSAPLSPVSPIQQGPVTGVGSIVPPIIGRPVVEEPDTLSPDSDQTVTPKDPLRTFSRQTSLLVNRRFPGGPLPLTRTDSLPPPTIVSDIPSPPLQYSIGPSGNPMEMMKPTNATESAYFLEQEIFKIENSPPPSEPMLVTMSNMDESPLYIKPDPSPEFDFNQPPDIELNGEEVFDIDMDYIHFDESHDISDFSTPPPSSGPSTENTPDTRLSDSYTASPSPASDFGIANAGHLAASPKTFGCDQCHRVFDQIHKLNHHKRYHDRPHECTFDNCTMRFGTKTHLDRHVNDKHLRNRKYFCTFEDCPYSKYGGKSFPRKDNWRRHLQNKHNYTPNSDPGSEYVEEINHPM